MQQSQRWGERKNKSLSSFQTAVCLTQQQSSWTMKLCFNSSVLLLLLKQPKMSRLSTSSLKVHSKAKMGFHLCQKTNGHKREAGRGTGCSISTKLIKYFLSVCGNYCNKDEAHKNVSGWMLLPYFHYSVDFSLSLCLSTPILYLPPLQILWWKINSTTGEISERGAHMEIHMLWHWMHTGDYLETQV